MDQYFRCFNVNFFFSSVQVGLYNNFLFRSRDQQIEVSEWSVLNVKWVIFQMYRGENKLILMRWWWWWCSLCTRSTYIYTVLVHWNNSSRVHMSFHSDTLFWFWANQFLLLLLSPAYLVGNNKNQLVTVRQHEHNLICKSYLIQA